MYETFERALTRRADARTAVDTKPTGVTYVDDRVQFGARLRLEDEIEKFSSDACGTLGPTAVNHAKTVLSTCFDTIGWRFNTIEGTVSPSPRAIIKLIYVFSVATPPDIKAGAPMKVRQLQRLSLLAIRYSLAMMPLRPFSSAFAKNTGDANADRDAVRHLSRLAHADILAWRRALELGAHNPKLLTIRASWLAIDAMPPHEQATCADHLVWVDAQGQGGIGVYAPGIAWDGHRVTDTQYFLSGGKRANISNNIYEFFAIVSGLAVVLRAHTHTHVHVYTNNTAALAWAQKCRGGSGFHTLLIRVLCDLQVATGSHLTVSHDGAGCEQRTRGRHQQELPGIGRVGTADANRDPGPSDSSHRPTLGDLQQRAEIAFSNSIGDRSRRTYGIGVRHWDEFRATYVIPELDSGGDNEDNVAAFLAYLFTMVGVAPQTADSYNLSHVVKQAVATWLIESSESIHTLFNRGVLRDFKRRHDEASPARDRTRIPLTSISCHCPSEFP